MLYIINRALAQGIGMFMHEKEWGDLGIVTSSLNCCYPILSLVLGVIMSCKIFTYTVILFKLNFKRPKITQKF